MIRSLLTFSRAKTLGKVSVGASIVGLALYSDDLFTNAYAFSTADHGLHAAHYPWDFQKFYKSYDHAALRRGYQVYKEICSACHSMDYIHFRNLVGVTHTEAEAKELAGEYEYTDGPNDRGEMFTRPGKVY
jgi:ubiquinol-cytochrome c reductase cytochrome c1 subunit